ncbi:MAG: deoxyguanosinetriphosphate triphosphohydrolase [Desulfuromonadales bacterium]|nr:deoxyguanosinetriphosphate triphosphohydrolase [Desulfuromonadales bacterium]
MHIRHAIESSEASLLSEYASHSQTSKGRRIAEDACSVRTIFQVDRDRILHSKAFRRLKYKTQVFLAPEGDHYRTRLTHTLEVSQVARTMARALRLNEDLTEAIALGHDLGHTPFGHAGERVLAELLPDGFHHVNQSLRVVTLLEKNGAGLNLSWEVRDGILRHSKGKGALQGRSCNDLPATLEGQLVRLSDVIAYVNHDLDDAIRGGLICNEDVPSTLRNALGDNSSQRLNVMITDLIETTLAKEYAVVQLSTSVAEHVTELRNWLYTNVYCAEAVEDEFRKASRVLREIFAYFIEKPQELIACGGDCVDNENIEIVVADFIAGMTDRYAMNLYQKLFFPQPWKTL